MSNSPKTPAAIATPAKTPAKAATPTKKVEIPTVMTLATVKDPGKKFTTLEAILELKGNTKIKMTQANPKRPSSKIYSVYEMYKSAKTIDQYAEKFGKGWQAGVKYDYQHGFLTMV
jgi:hypothetical protein